MNLQNLKKIYFTGIKGVGMTALACIAKDFGMEVGGSDVGDSFVTDQILQKKGISIDKGFKIDNINSRIEHKSTSDLPEKDVIDLLVYTAAHQGENNPEVKAAKYLNIPSLTFGEALGRFFNTKSTGISVAGVGGKTSTSAMLTTVLENAQQNPSYMIGVGEIPSLDFPGKYNHQGSVFISEADEYACSTTNHNPKFYYQNPQLIILTNLAFDHPDIYKDKQHTLQTFFDFACKLPADGKLIANLDSQMVQDLLIMLRASDKFEGKIITYGENPLADWQLVDYVIKNQQAYLTIDDPDDERYQLKLNIPGIYNAKNAIATLIASIELKLDLQQVQFGLLKFIGTKRRFEKIGENGSNLFYDDYAHHPDEIKVTLKAARKWFDNKKIITIFQPHTFSRTKALFQNFVNSFEDSDQTIILDIFPSAREPFDDSINSQMLTKAIQEQYPHQKISYAKDFDQVLDLLQLEKLQNTVVITMGAGDVYKLHQKINKEFI